MIFNITNHACEQFQKRFIEVKTPDPRGTIKSIISCSEMKRSKRHKSKATQYAFTNAHFKAVGIKRNGVIFITTILRNGHE